jgi:hypothetical protein
VIVLDICCGLGGFGQAFRDRGHKVYGLDIVPPADVIADARALPFRDGCAPDALIASPPCTEFSRESMPWCRTGKAPDMSIMRGCLDAVKRLKPRFWVIENVRGARPYMPLPVMKVGSRYLWGHFPLILMGSHGHCFGKERVGPNVKDRARVRSLIPYDLSLALCKAMEVEIP